MFCLNLRLPPARKAWKSFTSKLQSKLHKLQRSKAIKKPRNRHVATTAGVVRSSLYLEQRLQRKRRLKQRSHTLHKKAAPVYVDKLFRETAYCPESRKIKLIEEAATAVPGTRKEGGKIAERSCAADDMWESVGLASPQMIGIDERAEEFIVRFRAEMELQEALARRL